MSDQSRSHHPRRREVIKTGIFAGVAAALPWEIARAELREVARNRTMTLV